MATTPLPKRLPSKPNKKGRSEREQKHVRLYWWALESWAYRNLSPTARALLVEFLFLYNGSNNGELWMSQRDAARALGLKTHPTAAKYLKELVDWGFLKVRMKGHFSNKTGLATGYTLTMFERGKDPATMDFMKIQPRSKEEKERAQKIIPAWIFNRPNRRKFRPEEWEDGPDLSACFANFGEEIGSSDYPTYSMPSPRADERAEGVVS